MSEKVNANFFEDRKVACLDIHTPIYIASRVNLCGAGDVGSLYPLIDKAAEAGFRIIQLNPIQDTITASPYMGTSIFSYNPIFLWLGGLDKETQQIKIPSRVKKELPIVQYRHLREFKLLVLKQMYDRSNIKIKIEDFDREVVAYALFSVLKRRFKRSWANWPKIYKEADLAKILSRSESLREQVRFVLFSQSILRQQWLDVAAYARKKGIYLCMDKPIYPVYGSAEVWANQHLFYLNKDGSLKYKSGCNNPRDPFGEQVWGHAVYQFKQKPDEVINYFAKSIGFIAETSKMVRLDHSLALIWKYYLINAKTKKGHYEKALKSKIFDFLIEKFPDVFFVAEDVGYSAPKIDRLLSKYELPGMRSPQWTNRDRYTKTSRYPFHSVAVASSHDLDTVSAWWSKLDHQQRYIYYKKMTDLYKKRQRPHRIRIEKEELVRRVIKMVFDSPAQIAVVTLRDLSGDERRYNMPGQKNRTNWKLHSPRPIEETDFGFIKKVIEDSGRRPKAPS